MKKEIVLILLIAVLFGGGVYASGQADKDDYRTPRDFYGQFDQEPVELTGTLELINDNPPYLNVGTEKYLIMVPFHLIYNLDVENGESVTVSGYEMPGRMWQWDDSEKALHVISATIKGEEYDLGGYYGGGYMGGGRRFGQGRQRGWGCWNTP